MSRATIGPKTSQRILRELVFLLIWLSGLPWLLRWKHRNSPRILVFHGFYNDQNPAYSSPVNLWVHQPTSLLKRQLHHLSKHYQSVSTQQIQSWLQKQTPLPLHAVGVHMDDGLQSVSDYAAPLFQAAGWTFDLGLISSAYAQTQPASWEVWLAAAQQQLTEDTHGHYFLNSATRYIRGNAAQAEEVVNEAKALLKPQTSPFEEDPDMKRMSWKDIVALQQQGFGLINHTCHHEVLNKLDRQAIIKNLQTANASIASHTGVTCDAFVYPTGVVDKAIAQAVESAGFPFAYSLINGMITPEQHRQMLPRIGIPSVQGYYEFVCRVAGVHAFFLSLKHKP